ncbi:MAG: c-type cytochrome [Nitrosomonadales bacterium]
MHLLIIFCMSMGASQSVTAEDARDLARKSGCFNCHAIATDEVGPAWRSVADKYRGDAGAEARLVEKVSKGGKGVWGFLSMPAFGSQLKEAEIRTLVRYVLSLK